jgi:hypothetical protein
MFGSAIPCRHEDDAERAVRAGLELIAAPWETIYRWFAAWRGDGRFERINHALVMADR